MIIQTDKPLRPRDAFDHYPSPDWVIEAALDLIEAEPQTILDPGAGSGAWGAAARRKWPDAWIVGVELRPVAAVTEYSRWYSERDFLGYPVPGSFDLIIGNPPYRYAEAFIHRSLELLAPNGSLVFLLPLRFLEGQRRRDGIFHRHPPKEVHVCSKRPSFTGDNKTDATAYALFMWSKCWRGTPSLKWLKENPSLGT